MITKPADVRIAAAYENVKISAGLPRTVPGGYRIQIDSFRNR